MKRLCKFILWGTVAWALAACSLHTVEIQQGNIITPEMVEQLKPGMTKQQVRFVMGTPTIIDTFHRDRWDYVYTLEDRAGKREQKHVTLSFDGDELRRIETAGASPDSPPENKPNG